MSRKGDRIDKISLHEDLQNCIERHKEKYTSDLWVIATSLVGGHQGVGGVFILRDLEKRHPKEYRELKEITRKALLVAEGGEDYLPEGYVLNRSDPDVLILTRDDGTLWPPSPPVGSPSRESSTPSGITRGGEGKVNDKEREKDLEELRGLVHTGPSSPWTGMKMASLKRKYPRHYLKFQDEKKEKER